MCVRGASALEDVLGAMPDAAVRVFVVWEPVLATDLGPPAAAVAARVPDPRVSQHWDPERVLSDAILRTGPPGTGLARPDHPDPSSRVVWDTVAVFRPGVRWDASFPAPDYQGRPVVAVADELRRAVVAAGAR